MSSSISNSRCNFGIKSLRAPPSVSVMVRFCSRSIQPVKYSLRISPPLTFITASFLHRILPILRAMPEDIMQKIREDFPYQSTKLCSQNSHVVTHLTPYIWVVNRELMFSLVEVSFLASVNTGQKGKARKGSVNKATFYFCVRFIWMLQLVLRLYFSLITSGIVELKVMCLS